MLTEMSCLFERRKFLDLIVDSLVVKRVVVPFACLVLKRLSP